MEEDGQQTWESGPNRKFKASQYLPKSHTQHTQSTPANGSNGSTGGRPASNVNLQGASLQRATPGRPEGPQDTKRQGASRQSRRQQRAGSSSDSSNNGSRDGKKGGGMDFGWAMSHLGGYMTARDAGIDADGYVAVVGSSCCLQKGALLPCCCLGIETVMATQVLHFPAF